MSTDHNSGMPPIDTFAVDQGSFASESTFPTGSASIIAGDHAQSGQPPVGFEPSGIWDTAVSAASPTNVSALGQPAGALGQPASALGQPASALGQPASGLPISGRPELPVGGLPVEGLPIEGVGAGVMEFRVIRSGLPVRRLRLTGNRYTFGSADGCSIQLNDPALRPMHAVLIRDTSRILVRAYSVPIELNDTRTTEATLQVGDVVRLGAYSFELLSTSSAEFQRPASYSAVSAPLNENSEAWREQLRREISQWRARQAECDRREGRCDDREAVLRGRESELWSRAEQLHRRESRLMGQESAALQIQEDYAAQQQELVRLRDENRAKQQAFAERETEFRSLEQEYRQHVDEASRQLLQSQQQAESATQAVQRMRDQFGELNKQLEELQTQQSGLQEREQQQREEHERLRSDLQRERDEAIDGKADADSLRHEIEHRIDEMEAQIRQAQAECEAERQRADENENVAGQLREQIEQLQENVRTASEEATQLRQDYEQACESVRSLEAMIEQGNHRGEMDRESWHGEAEELRQSVEQLSIDLAQANGELSDLREANQSLTQQLDQLTSERDESRDDLHSRPTQKAFQSLREELDNANEKIAELQQQYEDTLGNLESAQQETQTAQQWAAEAEEKVAEVESQIVDAEARIADADKRVAEADARADDASSRADEADARANEANAQLESLKSQTESTVSDDEESSQNGSSLLGLAGAAAASSVSWAASDHDDSLIEEDRDPEQVDDGEGVGLGHGEQVDAEQNLEAASDHQETSNEENQGWPTYESSADTESEGPSGEDQLDDAPQWSTEPMQSTEAPHFDTGNDDAWSQSGDATPNNEIEGEGHTEEFSAEFDRSANGDWSNDSYSSANESVDNAIDEIEKNVDDAMADEVTTDSAGMVEHDVNGLTEDGHESVDDPSIHDVASENASDREPSPWGYDAGDDEPSDQSQDSPADVTSPWNSESTFGESNDSTVSDDDAWAGSDLTGTAHEDETEDELLNPWQTINHDGSEPDGEYDQTVPFGETSESQSESLGLADQLIQDIGTSTDEPADASAEDGSSEDPTYQWEQTEPFASEADSPEQSGFASPQNNWDQEYPEESRSSEWTNNVDGDHTEMIQDSVAESLGSSSLSDSVAYDPADEFDKSSELSESSGLTEPAEEASVDDSLDGQTTAAESNPMESTAEESVAEESATNTSEEEDDSIEAYMNRLLNRVQGSPASDTSPTQSTPLVPSGEATVEQLGETTAESIEASASAEPMEPDAPLVPRSQAPERNSDLSAMRELANSSARTAVARSVKIQARDTQIKAMMKFAQAGVAGICALACFTFLNWGFVVKLFVVGAILVIAGILVQEGLVLLKEARRRMSMADKGGDEAMVENTEDSIDGLEVGEATDESGE